MFIEKTERADFAIVADPALRSRCYYRGVGRLRRLKAIQQFLNRQYSIPR